MLVLGIESSCDETSASLVENARTILSTKTATSLDLQKQYGGVVPEVASRKQTEYIIPVLTEAFRESGREPKDIDTIAVTIGPGLMGSLLVGVETAKTLSLVWQKPLVPVNHLVGHIYSAWLDQKDHPPSFPLLALIVSGGHTDLVLMKSHNDLTLLGSTIDDAAGEAFDKVARMLHLPYPGGPEIEKSAHTGNPQAYDLPRPLLQKDTLNFSFSGLKTAVLTRIKNDPTIASQPSRISDMAASFQSTVAEILLTKTLRALEQTKATTVLVTGGVAANKYLREVFTKTALEKQFDLFLPPLSLATDNASYIAAAGYFLADKKAILPYNLDLLTLQPNPNLTVTEGI